MSETQPCPYCNALALVELCHLAPDPSFICDACHSQYDEDGNRICDDE
ncbi:hypothetical protein [Acidovorax sp.]|nr:hypothetical protein [Acidovorax sp.]